MDNNHDNTAALSKVKNFVAFEAQIKTARFLLVCREGKEKVDALGIIKHNASIQVIIHQRIMKYINNRVKKHITSHASLMCSKCALPADSGNSNLIECTSCTTAVCNGCLEEIMEESKLDHLHFKCQVCFDKPSTFTHLTSPEKKLLIIFKLYAYDGARYEQHSNADMDFFHTTVKCFSCLAEIQTISMSLFQNKLASRVLRLSLIRKSCIECFV